MRGNKRERGAYACQPSSEEKANGLRSKGGEKKKPKPPSKGGESTSIGKDTNIRNVKRVALEAEEKKKRNPLRKSRPRGESIKPHNIIDTKEEGEKTPQLKRTHYTPKKKMPIRPSPLRQRNLSSSKGESGCPGETEIERNWVFLTQNPGRTLSYHLRIKENRPSRARRENQCYPSRGSPFTMTEGRRDRDLLFRQRRTIEKRGDLLLPFLGKRGFSAEGEEKRS